MMKKAQTQAITLVLISGIIIALTGTAFFWGKPLVEKRAMIGRFQSSIDFMKNLNDKIKQMARTCKEAGACEESLDLPVPGLIYLNVSDNSIIYEYVINQKIIGEGTEIPVNTGNVDEITSTGEEPGIVFLSGIYKNNAHYIKLKLHYRTLYDEKMDKEFLIKLTGNEGAGNNRVTVVYRGIDIEGKTTKYKIEVRVI